jgi:hypothetical protein
LQADAYFYEDFKSKDANVIVNSPVINGVSAFDQIDPPVKGRDDIGACLDQPTRVEEM